MRAKNRHKNRQRRKKVGIKSSRSAFEKKEGAELPFFQIFQQAALLYRNQVNYGIDSCSTEFTSDGAAGCSGA